MSVHAIAWAIDQKIDNSSAKLVLVVLANCINGKTRKCCPKLRTLAKNCTQSERTVRRNLEWLEQNGFIRRIAYYDKIEGQRANDYQLLWDPNYAPFSSGGDEDDIDPRERPRMTGGPPVTDDRGGGHQCPGGEVTDDRANRGTGRGNRKKEPEEIECTHQESTTSVRKTGGKKTRFPENLTLDQDMIAFASERGWDPHRSASEFERFRAHHEAKDSRMVNWAAAWRTWALNGLKFDHDRKPVGSSARKNAAIEGVLAQAFGRSAT
jgi:hypothetical protein